MCVCNSVFYRHRVFLLLFISFLSLSLLLHLRQRRVFFHSFHSLFQVVEAFCYLYSDSAIQCWLQIKSLYELRNRVFCALHTLVVVRRRCCLAQRNLYNMALSAIDRLIVANAYLLYYIHIESRLQRHSILVAVVAAGALIVAGKLYIHCYESRRDLALNSISVATSFMRCMR